MKRKHRLLRRLIVAAALVVLFTVTGFLILPPIVRSQLEQRLSALLGRRVTVEKVGINPYALSLTLENFAIREAGGTAPFLGWRRLHVNFDALSSLHGEWVLGNVELDGFDARPRLNADQSFNFSDILAKVTPPANAPPPPKPDKPARPVRIVRLQVSDARVDLVDHSRAPPFATVLGPLTFAVTEFRTVSERGAPYRFEAVTEAGEKLAWSGTLQAEPFRSAGELRLENIILSKYAPYYADRMHAELASGTLSVRGHYEIELAERQQTLKFADGNVQVRDLKLLERGSQEPALEVPAFDVTGVQADALAMKATIASVSIAGGRVRARREKDGTINLLTMLQPPAPAAPASAPSTPSTSPPPSTTARTAPKPPDVTVLEFALKDFQVEMVDHAAPRQAQLALSNLQLSVRNVTLAPGAQMPMQLAFAWAPQGTVRLEGTIGIDPLKADLKADVAGLALLPVSPYAEQFVNARLTQGTFSANVQARVAVPTRKRWSATVTGDLWLDRLGIVDGAHNEELAGFEQFTLWGLRASTEPEFAIALEKVSIAAPYARVIVNADKSLNVTAVAGKTTASGGAAAPPTATTVAAAEAPATPLATAAAAPASPGAPAARPKIEIGGVVIVDGDYRFIDRSVQPNVRMAINQFGGTIAGLSSTNPAKSSVALKAMVDGAGPVSIGGRLDPLGAKKSVDLKLDFKSVDLLPLSPYSGKYAGYELARGKLLLDVKLLVDGPNIDVANVITLNQFTFGSPVKSPDATSLPVRLGVALLKDMEGKIVIDVPVQGSTDDPSFKIGRVVQRVIVNLLTKAAVSPFSLLGAAFGGGGEELAFQEFAPGSAQIQAAEMKKLVTMTQALTNRPGLGVGIEGGYDVAADTHALKRVKLADRVRRAIWEAKRQADPNLPPPEKLEISAEKYVAMLKKLYDEKFPPGTHFGTPVPAKPEVVAPPPPPQSFFQRIVHAITFQARRDRRAAEQENARLSAEHERAVAAAIAAGLPREEMTGRLAETVTIDENDLRELAQARAQHVRDYFTNTGKIAPDRLFLAKPQTTAAHADATQQGKGPRVFLELQ